MLTQTRANRDIVAIGTSAGGVEAALYLARHLPADLPASVLLTIHLPSDANSQMDVVLSNAGGLRASFARDGEVMRTSHIYIAPPDRHLLLGSDGRHLHLGTGPRENNSRPAIDPMLRSVALCCGGRTAAAVLTGTLGDGASGLWAVHSCGGVSIVQDPYDAAFPQMPQNALMRTNPDHLVSLAAMPALIENIVGQPAGESGPAPPGLRYEVDIARGGKSEMKTLDDIGHRSVFACPDCNGVMWEINEGELTRYRCHVGHTYTAEMMALALDETLRRAFASAQRALEERLALAHKLERQAAQSGHKLLTTTWANKAHEAERELAVMRDAFARLDEIAVRERLKRTA